LASGGWGLCPQTSTLASPHDEFLATFLLIVEIFCQYIIKEISYVLYRAFGNQRKFFDVCCGKQERMFCIFFSSPGVTKRMGVNFIFDSARGRRDKKG